MNLISQFSRATLVAAFVPAVLPFSAMAANATLPQVLAEDLKGSQAYTEAQKNIEEMRAKETDLQSERQSLAREARLLERYREKLRLELKRTEEAASKIEADRESLRKVRMEAYPLMEQMCASLEAFVGKDLPFLRAERDARIAHIKDVMTDPAFTDADRMDLLLDAWQVEASYGYTVGTDSGRMPDGELAEFLRIGRLGYFAVNSPKKKAFVFDDGEWKPLDDEKFNTLQAAADSAAGRSAPSILIVPESALQKEKKNEHP